MSATISTIGQRLRYSRLQKGLTIHQAERKARLSAGEWIDFELDKRRPGVLACVRIADLLEGHCDWLLFGDEAGIASRLRQSREAAGLTIAEAADAINVSHIDWQALEHDLAEMSAREAYDAAKMLGVTFDWLVAGDD